MAIGMQHVATLPIDHIDVPKGRRPIDPKTVETLVNSIKEIGLQNPITVRRGDNRHILVAGLHRLEALRKLGRDRAPCLVVDMSDVDARLWEIAENLHRSDLTAQERAEQIAQWVRLTEQKGVSAQLAPKPQGGRPESGVSQAARTLKVPKSLRSARLRSPRRPRPRRRRPPVTLVLMTTNARSRKSPIPRRISRSTRFTRSPTERKRQRPRSARPRQPSPPRTMCVSLTTTATMPPWITRPPASRLARAALSGARNNPLPRHGLTI